MLVFILWLCVAASIYFGGVVLSHLELPQETLRRDEFCEQKQTLQEFYSGATEILEKVEFTITRTGICRAPKCKNWEKDIQTDASRYSDQLNWSYQGGAFFFMTTVTTVGYGTYVPTTALGKVFTMAFAVLGILTFDLTSQRTCAAIEFLMAKRFGSKHQCLRWGVLVLLWAFIMTLFYHRAENWRFTDSAYFTFITLTTVGFGDITPTKTRDSPFTYIFILGGVSAMKGFFGVLLGRLKEAHVKKPEVEKRKGWWHCCIRVCTAPVRGMLHMMHVIGTYLAHHVPLTVLWLGLLLFCFLGGAIFRQLELNPHEGLGSPVFKQAWEAVQPAGEAQTELLTHLGMEENRTKFRKGRKNGDKSDGGRILSTIVMLMNAQGTCPPPLEPEVEWGYVNAAMFAMTIVTTIGYGNIVPRTKAGKAFCVPFTLMGFCLFAITQKRSSERLSAYLKTKTHRSLELMEKHTAHADSPQSGDTPKDSDEDSQRAARCSCLRNCLVQCFKCLLRTVKFCVLCILHFFFSLLRKIAACFPRTTILVLAAASGLKFMVICAIFFTATENWTFMIAFWFTFSSMLTIGYGDFTPLFHEINFVLELILLGVGLTFTSLVMQNMGLMYEMILSGISSCICCGYCCCSPGCKIKYNQAPEEPKQKEDKTKGGHMSVLEDKTKGGHMSVLVTSRELTEGGNKRCNKLII